MKFIIEPSIKEKIQGIAVVTQRIMDVTVKTEGSFDVSPIQDKVNLLSDPSFFEDSLIKSYQNFYAQLGFDPNRQMPSVEGLYRRYIKNGRFPNINNIVNAVNQIALSTMIPLGVFNLDNVRGDIVLRFSKAGEEFEPIGGGTEKMKPGMVIMVDDDKVLSQFFYRDSERIKIDEDAKNIVVLGCKVAGVNEQLVVSSVETAVDKIIQVAGGEKETPKVNI